MFSCFSFLCLLFTYVVEATRLLGNGVNSSRITARSRQLLAAVLLLQNSSLGSTLKTSMMQILIQICRHCLLVLSIPRSSHLSNSSSACLQWCSQDTHLARQDKTQDINLKTQDKTQDMTKSSRQDKTQDTNLQDKTQDKTQSFKTRHKTRHCTGSDQKVCLF